MKILYDHQIFTMQRQGGVSRYFAELIKEISDIPGVDVQTTIEYSDNNYLYKFEDYSAPSFFPKRNFRGKTRIQSFLNLYSSKRAIRKATFNLFHPTYYHPYFLSNIGSKPMVVTVYDMIHERLPHYFSNGSKISDRKKKIIKRADKVIAISKHTKNDLIELFGIKEEKIDVIYLGNSLDYGPQKGDIDLDWLPVEYILFVGIRSAYKNFQTFMESVLPIFQEYDELHLICVGGGGFQKWEKEFFVEHGVEKKVIQISCSDEELAHIYQNARCLVFPSLYEGFGLPILEAFSANCPIACSRCTSLPEVAGNAAVYFDPKSENEIRESVKKVIYDKDLQKRLIEKGKKRGKEFSWKETAHQTKKVYESLV